jgi:hypothetical protein
MIVWLNGTFGVGKTTTARELVPLLPNARMFDPEQVGYLLRHVLHEPVDDFQDHPPWRAIVRKTAASILDYVGGTIVAPQTILVEAYAREIFDGLDVRHFVLHAGENELVRRIEGDQVEAGAREWRLRHLPRYRDALPWLRAAATMIDTTGRAPAEVARLVAGHLG